MILFVSLKVLAEDLSNSAVLHRCYAQLTQTRLSLTSPLIAQVKNNTKDPITACLEVLDSARFVAPAFTQINAAAPAAKDVLQAFHHLHASWFENKQFILINEQGKTEHTRAALDVTAPAAFFTKALFDPNLKFSSAVLTNSNFSPVRSIASPTQTQIPPITYNTYPTGFIFAPVGDLLGVSNRVGITQPGTTANVSLSFGAGMLGTQSYLMSTVNERSGFSSNGSVNMPRKWAKSVFHDLLCRNLPAARQSDGAPFVDLASDAPFRRSTSCVHCHASMDRMSAVMRNFVYHDSGAGNYAGNIFTVKNATQTASTGNWLSIGNSAFSRMTPATGVLFYRNYQGRLIDQNVSNLADLGLKISESDDFYICAAKRYYEYFMGVNADIGDLGDPSRPVSLSAAEQKHREIVINLGLSLKTHQSVRTTIESILRMPAYKKSDFNRGSP